MKNLFNKSIIILFSLTLTFATTNCVYAQQSGMKAHHASHADAMTGATSEMHMDGAEFKDAKVAAIYKSYHALYEALATDNLQAAQKAAVSLSATAKAVSGATGIAAGAKKVASAKTIEAQRKEFSAISSDMIALFKKGVLKKGEVYAAFCPMANGGQGAYWLTSEKKIANPYYGSKMSGCGSIKETLK
ncbi:DUF3347 domain-containing protein [uncultured Bacteroides sp.]|uniref:DUF3347 domain-containing protein n=1 Tax=uncultured Bacteroides sp. TaxID=162156 RepID=UPI002AA770DA|nr:DUF3347 domain-containing protein [uncultured Bacteroides sp.]